MSAHRTSRRMILRGLAGVTLGLPILESVSPFGTGSKAHAQDPTQPPFFICFRQANGVQSSRHIDEEERFFPRTDAGTALTEASMAGRAVEELAAFRDRLLIVGNVNLRYYDEYADGHANGAIQALTARGPEPGTSAGDSMASGESLDNRIARELNESGSEALYLYAGQNSGWLGGACISWRGAGAANKRSPYNDPWSAYLSIIGSDGGDRGELEALAARRASINDLLRDQTEALRSSPRLSADDRSKLDQHFSSIRDLELALSCQLDADQEAALEGQSVSYASTDGNEVLATARLHMRVAALAVACGQTRSVAIQVGGGNDGNTRYWNGDQQMENYHYVSHRVASHGADGTPIDDADLLHHAVDRQFAATFRYLLEQLDAYPTPGGGSLLDAGIALWYNDNANGPPHGARYVPYIVAGSAGGQLRQGHMIELGGGSDERNHDKLLNTLGTVVGLRNADGGPLDDFGDEGVRGLCPEIMT